MGKEDTSMRQDSTSIARNKHTEITTVQVSTSIVPVALSGDNHLGSTHIAQMSPDRKGDMSNELPRTIQPENAPVNDLSRHMGSKDNDHIAPVNDPL